MVCSSAGRQGGGGEGGNSLQAGWNNETTVQSSVSAPPFSFVITSSEAGLSRPCVCVCVHSAVKSNLYICFQDRSARPHCAELANSVYVEIIYCGLSGCRDSFDTR